MLLHQDFPPPGNFLEIPPTNPRPSPLMFHAPPFWGATTTLLAPLPLPLAAANLASENTAGAHHILPAYRITPCICLRAKILTLLTPHHFPFSEDGALAALGSASFQACPSLSALSHLQTHSTNTFHRIPRGGSEVNEKTLGRLAAIRHYHRADGCRKSLANPS